MNTNRYPLARRAGAALILMVALASSAALAATKGATLDAKQRYLRESAACAAVRAPDDRAKCLSEASTRFASTQPTPAQEQADVLMSNALKRCEPLPVPERADCVARVHGQGTTSGSVESGGIYRELVTIEVGTPVTPAPVPDTPPLAPAK